MLKKCAILGLAVLLVGGGALGWLLKQTRSEQAETTRLKAKYLLNADDYLNKYDRWHLLSPEEQSQLVLEMDRDRQTKSREQLAGEQQARLRVDLEKLAAYDEMYPAEITDFLYGAGWQQQVQEYKKQQEQKEIARTASVVCISIGGVMLGGCILIWLGYGLVGLGRVIGARFSRDAEKDVPTPPPAPELTEIHTETPAANAGAKAADSGKSQGLMPIPIPLEPAGSGDRPKSGPQMLEEGFLPRTLGLHASSARRATLTLRKAPENNQFDTLMSDDVAEDKPWSADTQWSVRAVPENDYGEVVDDPRFRHEPAVATLDREAHAPELPNGLKEQAEDLQKQLAEVKQMAQNMQQATQGQPGPLNNTLKELAQQVSAIRDYAASQQGRVEKLQDGYDWGIIRTFCLRVIRCVDNVEKRIAEVEDGDEAAVRLEEVRDELLFALESSGVEQFEPEIHSDYRGQEKLAEAVKEKEPSNKPDQAGRIAKVLRPGYRYIIDDDNFKVVRTAQVKLFG